VNPTGTADFTLTNTVLAEGFREEKARLPEIRADYCATTVPLPPGEG